MSQMDGGPAKRPEVDLGEVQRGRSDVLEFGGPAKGRPPPWRRWAPWVLAALLAIAVVVAVTMRGHQDRAPTATPTPTPTPVVTTPSDPTTAPGLPGPRTVDTGRPLLGIRAKWDLFGYGPAGVVRIEWAAGRVVTTEVPHLNSSGPVSFIATPTGAVVRPLDGVLGYLVPDGAAARELTGRLGNGGPALPGPTDGTVWVPGDQQPDRQSYILLGANGRPTGTTVTLPAAVEDGFAEPDGTGYLTLTGVGGVYLAKPGGLTRITTGILLATGPTRWLAQECDDQARCGPVVIDRGNGARHPIRTPPGVTAVTGVSGVSEGLISPDGRTAALLAVDPGGSDTLQIVDLTTGGYRSADIALDQSTTGDGTMVWAPDSSLLFVASANGQLLPIDPKTGKTKPLPVTLQPVTLLAVRP
jgi:hypothetical protein